MTRPRSRTGQSRTFAENNNIVFLTAISYARRSFADERLRRAVAEQSEENRDAAESMQAKLVREFFEPTAIPASRFATRERKAWADLMEYIANEPVDIVIMWEPSRGSREMGPWVEFLDLCRAQRTLIHITSHNRTYDSTNARDRRSLLEDGTDSEYESERLSGRVKRTMKHNAKKGEPHGRNILGYRRVYTLRNDTRVLEGVEIVPDEAQRVRDAYARFASGESIHSILRDFPGWRHKRLRELLTNPAYIGKRVHREQLHEAIWEPIVDEGTWQACVDRLNDPKRRTNRGVEVKHLLSGIARCGICGGPMHPKKHHNDLFRYACAPHGHTDLYRDEVDAYVVEKIKERLFRLDISAEYGDDDSKERQKLENELRDTETRLDELKNELKRSNRPINMLIDVISELESDAESIRSALRREKVPVIIQKVRQEPKDWDDRDLAEQRELIRTMVAITILPGRKGKRLPIKQRVKLTDPVTGAEWIDDND